MDRAPVTEAATVAGEELLAGEEQAEHLYRWLQNQVGEQARKASTMTDVASVAERVAVLKQHRPRTYDVVASTDADGRDYTEHGFATEDGSVVSLEEPKVLCEQHDDLTPWPCPEVGQLIEAFGGRSERTETVRA